MAEPERDADPTEGESFEEKRSRFCSIRDSVSVISVSQVGLFVLVLGWVLYHSRPVLMPVLMALLVSLVLNPVYRVFRKARLPRILASALTVSGLVGLLGFGAYQLVEPGAQWMESLNQDVVSRRLQEVFRPVKEVQSEIERMAHRVESVTAGTVTEDAEGTEGEVAKVQVALPKEAEEVKGPVIVQIQEDPVDAVVATTQDLGVGTVAFLFLVLFALAYGNRIVRRLGEEEHAAVILERMAEDVSRYLFTITTINFCLGLGIGLAMWGLGMPNPALWGVLGMVLNFIPYLGALIGTGMVFLAAAATFDQASQVLVVPCVYFGLTALEGNVVTPLVLGGRFRLNPLVVFLWVFLWAGVWGVAGMLVAMPALVTFKIVCENMATMEGFRRVLTA
ncbi:putative PurR-regulated permease PerM [Haloferula luteola]|uniref:Putative PurR-regulated permease PerM n=1 Tax=Haloferula luteola TaxID=595692 RepID=A0A840VDF4_9BACT|nr:AI-2E family transporter [Haloferula luteola]MBB5351849.1 putative PurR-regulated permease PerM [Haloferula luteola]